MLDAKCALAKFMQDTGLQVEKVLEHRSVEWSPGEKESMLTMKVAGKAHPAFILFNSSGLSRWGYILPTARYGLKNEASD